MPDDPWRDNRIELARHINELRHAILDQSALVRALDVADNVLIAYDDEAVDHIRVLLRRSARELAKRCDEYIAAWAKLHPEDKSGEES